MDFDHGYYKKTPKEQNRIQLTIALLSLGVNVCVLMISILSSMYFIAIFSIAITLSVIAPFFDTPSLIKSGSLQYYSPLFLAEKEKNGTIAVHGGTLFDYVFVIDKSFNGRQRTNFIIKNYLEGLLNLIATYESQNVDSLKIKGTSYIINERSAKKMGFSVTKTDLIQKIILMYNYVNLIASSSIAKAKLTFPNVKEIRTIEADLNHLIENKAYLMDLNNRLNDAFVKKA